MLEILTNGPLNTVQDLGRPGAMSIGASGGGVMDRQAFMHGNILCGNVCDAAGIEIAYFPFKVRFHAACLFAVTGARSPTTLSGKILPDNWCHAASPGDILTLAAPDRGVRAYLCVSGGIDLPILLGGRGTDIRSGFGGYLGRGLQKNDRLPLSESTVMPAIPRDGHGLSTSLSLPMGGTETLSLIPAAEYDAFTDHAHQLLADQEWSITPSANRVGYRLEGAQPLSTTRALNLLSHGLLPGTVQVPPSGQPIVQMADANSCGGYPKIGIVIEDDLDRLSQMSPGTSLRFSLISRPEALERLRARRSGFTTLTKQLGTARTHLHV